MFSFIFRLIFAVRRQFSPKITPFFENDYVPQRLLDGSEKTVRIYRVTLNFFEEFIGKPSRLFDLNDKTVSAFAAWRLETVSRGTVKRDMDCLLAIWRFARDLGHLKRGPIVRPIHAPVPTPVGLSRDQVDALWQAIQEEDRPVLVCCSPRLEVPGHVWWSAIFLACWDTAERITPVFELSEGNIDLEKLVIKFPAENRKGQTSDNIKPIHPDTAEAIKRLVAYYPKRQHNSGIFRWASNTGTIWPRLGAIMERAGIPDAREFKFHCIRKSSVSYVKAAGGDSTAHAGHLNASITKRHYEVPEIVGLPQDMTLLFRPGQTG